MSGHSESAALTFDDEQAEKALFKADNPFKYIEEILYFDRSMEIASEIEDIICGLKNSPYNCVDWDIIIDDLPQGRVYRHNIYEVFDSSGKSKGLFENYSSEAAITYAYNSYNPDNKKWSNEIEWTANEVKVYGVNPNRFKIEL
ncbi:hypothetical protein D1872_268220 [compost metagenome]